VPKLKMEKLGVRVDGKIPLVDIANEEVPIGQGFLWYNYQ